MSIDEQIKNAEKKVLYLKMKKIMQQEYVQPERCKREDTKISESVFPRFVLLDEERQKEWENMAPADKAQIKGMLHQFVQEAGLKVGLELLIHLYNDLEKRIQDLERSR